MVFAEEKGAMSERPPNPDPSALSVRQKRLFSHTASRIWTFGMAAVQKRADPQTVIQQKAAGGLA